MEQRVLRRIAAMAQTKDAEDRSVSYLYQNMSCFLKKNERVLLLYTKEDTTVCRILERAVYACGCVPLWLGEDHRWMTMLRYAFTTKCSCIVGSPLILLGLSKLSNRMGTPLYVKNVLMAGYPTTRWLINGVRQGLDCMVWGCFDPGVSALISGFTCAQLDGIHIRDEFVGVDIVDEYDNVLECGELGKVMVYLKEDPSLRFTVGDTGRIVLNACSCGCTAPKIIDMDVVTKDRELFALGEKLLLWSSILDCHVEKTEYGLELELVVFPGEKLPKLPATAKRVVRAFNPERDAPMEHREALKNRSLSL